MASVFLSSILAKTSRQVLGFVHRWAVSSSSSSDPHGSVLKDLDKLERTLKRIQAVLHDAEEREIREQAVKLRLEELKEAAYDAEDVLDEFQCEELRAQVEGHASRERKRVEGDDEEEVSIPDGMGDRIREIRERFDEISKEWECLTLKEEDGERRVYKTMYPKPTSHMVDESSIYGREREKEEIIDLLFSEAVGNGISIIPIVGKGGLGKTTIAQMVYNDPRVKQNFNLTGWVCVSDNFDVPRLTKAIIESVTQKPCDLAQLSTLQETLKQKVKGQRVLLVLDDVWNEQPSHWEDFRNPFVGVETAETVTIIITCRNDLVAERAQQCLQMVPPYHLGCLSPEQSWSLFKHYAFGGRDPKAQPRLADIGEQIVKKCSGLPLALKLIGSLLRYTADEDSWMDVIQSDIWELDKNNEISPALRLSYSRMPAHLKPCFIYCSMFPKDYVFDKDELVRLWMAQGYIQPFGGRRRMEDIGHEYFNDLQRRSFFDTYDSDFKMHDIIHDLAKSIAGNECCAIVDKKLPSLPNEVRHLYVKDVEFLKSLRSYNFGALRTLLLWNQYRDGIVIQEIMKYLPCLRTLHLLWESVDKIPELFDNNLFGKLKHLRYLCIKAGRTILFVYERELGMRDLYTSNNFKKLSESICLLYHLQILVLECQEIAELPDGLGNLTNLRHFELRTHSIRRLPGSICLLYNLQTLVLDCDTLAELPDDLGNLTNLRYFELHTDPIKRLPGTICLLYHLQTLVLDCWQLVELPDGLGNLINLRHFELHTCRIRRLPGTICHLHKLQKLVLHGCADLEELPSGIGSLTNLRHLDIRDSKILCLPTRIGKLTNLRSLLGCYKVQGGIGVLKDLANLQGSLIVSGLRNLVNIGDARDAGLKHKHNLDKLCLHWPDLFSTYEQHLHALCIEVPCRNDADNCENGLHLEQWEEEMLEYLQPHANLKELCIKWYRGSKFPEWVGNPFSFASLQEINISWCTNIRSLPLYIHDSFGKLDAPIPKSMLVRVKIDSCWELTSIAGLHHLHSLRILEILSCYQLLILSAEGLPSKLQELTINYCPELRLLSEEGLPSKLGELTIKYCPQLRLLSEEGLPSNLETLYIEECQQLTSLLGMQNLTSLVSLTIRDCPKLQIMAEDRLSSMPDEVKIVNCPGLSNWCLIRNLKCIQVASGNKLTISNTWENIMHGFDDLTSIEHLCFDNHWSFLQTHSKFVLEELTIWSCMDIPLLSYLPELTSLRSLVIKDCPGIESLPCHLLPSTLKSFAVDNCENLSYLPLAHKNRDAFEELQLVNCPNLIWVQGLNCLFFPENLTIERCPRLQLPQHYRRPSIPPRVRNCRGNREQRNN